MTARSIRNATIPIAQLKAHPRNYRSHPERQLGRLSASLARFGQVRSIVVQEGAGGRYLLVAGHGLAEAAKREGMKELRADIIPADWTPEQVEGYLVADNMSGADDDAALLAEILQEQQNAGYNLESLGYDRSELDALLESLTQAKDAEWVGALGDLPDGDKAPFQQMTFTLTDVQAVMVRDALTAAKDDAPDENETGNANSNGNALAYIVGQFLQAVNA